ncbi:TetR/AcrR family transcriptional regulator [Caulobacter segnis]|uniref:TetR/AcrR family transcriptional regulator n=1 Tax=Caulobacter segnis TaxID=88688 RepID=UPI001CBE31AB|nr:TetR/AcrR family transcriptional regulator [Caulobacter segnis]UAL11503.1 TetR/AcrR family transcriptional regulator [Caulobacter segnis]
MTGRNTHSAAAVRGEPVRQRVIDAAERLLRQDKADFSMRDLAAEAGVSFATPFNQFGSKAAIMQALSARRIEAMEVRFVQAAPSGDALDRVRLAIDTAAAVMLEEPVVNRAVMGSLGAPSPTPGQVWAHSKALWALALGDGDGIVAERREQALSVLPGQLAFAFRGVLSFWTAGELPDDALAASARDVAVALMRGCMEPSRLPPPAQQAHISA